MTDKLWWQTGTVYQIYPLSFMDGNGDGKGDLTGIASRLDYLQSLGIDAVWFSPIFPSPFHDFGYDVADYTNVNPLFGTLDEFDELLAQAHARGMKVILDLVPNHTSIEHDWFKAARASRDNDKRDWYHWRDAGPDGGPPNNWQSFFGGDAWTFDETTGQYYLHLFDKSQPDLNWENPKVREAIYDAMRFWLARGVDGFRVDVIWLLLKDPQFRDEPENEKWREGWHSFAKHHHIYTQDLPGVMEIVREMRAVTDEFEERVLIGEIYLPLDRLVRYYGEFPDKALDGAHLPFNFGLITTPFDAGAIKQFVEDYEAHLPAGAWPNWVLGNHDRPRIATHASPGRARLAGMLLLTLRGTPTLYYGDELGIENAVLPDEYVNDPAATDGELRNPGRDPERTPMQWDATDHAGFSTASPWLPVSPDYETRNVAVMQQDETSILSLYKQLLGLRKAVPALNEGAYETLYLDGDVYAYARTDEAGNRYDVILNFGMATASAPVPAAGKIVLSTHLDRSGAAEGAITLQAGEGVIVHIS